MFLLATNSVSDTVQNNIQEANDNLSKLSSSLDKFVTGTIDFAFDIFAAVIIFIIGKIILHFARKLVKKILTKSDEGVTKFVDSLVKFLGYLIIIIAICAKIGIETTSLITLLGTAGLSIGLALQGALSNFAGGVLLMCTKPFVVDDYIIVDTVEGYVKKIDIIYTTLTTIDNKVVKIPNGTVASSVLTNVTYQGHRRLDIEVGIHYEDNVKQAKDILTNVMKKCEFYMPNEENLVVVKELSDSSVKIEIRMWVETDNYWTAKFYMNEHIKEAFDKEGIRIPYNQLDVNLIK